MKLFRGRDVHARFRELLAAQMDVPLHLDEAWQLNVHLSRCDRCRAAEREYREQRRALRALAKVPAPRDMWARTSAALDRDMARPWRAAGGEWAHGVRARRRRRSWAQRHGASAAVSLVVVGAAAMLAISQLPLLERAEPTRLRPTPFAVPVQALAYIGARPEGFSIYRTNVDQVCPVSASDCVNEHADPSAHRLPGTIEPSRLVLSPSGRQVAVTGIDGERDSVVAILTMPEPDGPPNPVAPATPFVDTTPRPVHANPPPLAPATAVTAATVAPTASSVPELAVLAILEDAIGVGAPPAWSSDEQMLAFSAMPSDGSRGPDIYVWRPGDLEAQKLTDDQASYFASWSGGRIVASRVTANEATEAPAATTLVIDPDTGEERTIDHPSLWLPQVNGPRSHAVAWQGTLAWRSSTVVPDSGALYLVDWTSIDPFADEPGDDPGDEPVDDPSPAPAESADPAEGPDPAEEPSTDPQPTDGERPTEPTASPAATVTATPLLVRLPPRTPTTPPDESGRTGEPETPATPAPDATDQPPTAAPATVAPSEAPSGDLDEDHGPLLQAIEPDRDPTDEPVRDWEVRWSPDGALLGFWIADAPGSSWGNLAVVRLDMDSRSLGLDAPLLSATLARRSFTVGADRVAWVAPVEHTPYGELRVTTWGPDGFGELRLVVPDTKGGVSPF